MFAGLTTRMWVGTRMPGQSAPLLIYWHGTGSSPAEVESFYGQQLDQILAQGGVVAALAESSGYGQDVGTGTWSTGDASIADEIVACTVQQRSIDPRRIYTAGCSSGGLMAGGTLYLRSSYIAAAMLDSGGSVLSLELEDPTHVPAVIASHGSASTDIVIVNFATLSEDFTMQVAGRGGFAVVCDHGGGHCGSPPAIRAAQWRFLSDHPYGTGPSPYANGLPPEFPEECRIATPR
jgi:poly(3-hydroxybutyrate) depolymerase